LGVCDTQFRLGLAVPSWLLLLALENISIGHYHMRRLSPKRSSSPRPGGPAAMDGLAALDLILQRLMSGAGS